MLEILFAIIAGLSDIFGGWLGLKTKIGKIMPRYIIGFAAGILISLTFLEVLPAVDMQSHAWLIAVGFFTFYIIEKLTMLHACGEGGCKIHKIGGVTVFGMALDNIVDGIGIAVGYATNPGLGLVITIGVVIHEIPQGIASAVIMKNARYSAKKTYIILAVAGVLYPVGAFLSSYIPSQFNVFILAFIAGDFLYIGASDLLPEAHKKFNTRVVVSVLLGLAFVIAMMQVFGPV
ncbi:ZIP family metal transporter [archaeon]|nr:ZIP family metal transporter [archaeon]